MLKLSQVAPTLNDTGGSEINFNNGPITLFAFNFDFMLNQPGQQWTVGAAQQGNGAATCPKQEGGPDVTEKTKWLRFLEHVNCQRDFFRQRHLLSIDLGLIQYLKLSSSISNNQTLTA